MAEEPTHVEDVNGEEDATPEFNDSDLKSDADEQMDVDESNDDKDAPGLNAQPSSLYGDDSQNAENRDSDNSQLESAEESMESDKLQNTNGEESDDADYSEKGADTKVEDFKEHTSIDLAEDGELFGFKKPQESSMDYIYSLIEKLEKEIDDTVSINVKTFESKKLKIISPSYSATETLSSRPSSGMSIRSDSDLININSDVANSSTGPSRSSLNRKSGVDLANPMYRVPFEFGWKRELVYRANLDSNLRRQADVYYYSPLGKKLRSTREVSEHLFGNDITVENFTFFKDALGIEDPEKEIIRGAKVTKVRTDSPQLWGDNPENVQPIVVEGKRTPKPKGPKGSSPDRILSKPIKVKSVGSRLSTTNSGMSPTGASPPSKKDPGTPKSGIRKSLSSEGSQIKKEDGEEYMEDIPYFGQIPEKSPSASPEKVYFGHSAEQASVPLKMYPSVAADSARGHPVPQIKKYTAATGNPPGGRDMCPMRCPLANKEPPSLQCSLCLCLYHSQCTGFLPNSNTSFVCKNCHMANSSLPVSPPQTSMNHMPTSRPASKPTPLITTVSPLRYPKPSATSNKVVPQPRLVPVQVPRQKQPAVNQSPKHPKTDNSSQKPNQRLPKPTDNINKSKYVNSNNIALQDGETDMTLFPQAIAIMNGHKFIVVPKPNTPAVPTPLIGQITNPKQADNVPKVTEPSFPVASGSNSTVNKPVTTSKSDSIVPTSVISFDNLSSEYSKLFKSDTFGNQPFDPRSAKRSASFELADEPSATKRKAKGPPVPKMIPKIAKKTENGSPSQKVIGGARGVKTSDAKRNHFADFYKANKERGYNSLVQCGIFVQIFQYLKMRELAMAARVCRMWREIADTPALWRSVRMKNSQVNDWDGLAAALKRHGTRHLDLRKMLFHHPPEETEIEKALVWDQFITHIVTVDTLLRLDLCRCPASVVERVCERMPYLQTLTATSIRCTSINLSPLSNLANLRELRIKSMNGMTLTSDLKCLENLKNLKHLCITSIKEINQQHCLVIGGLTKLESLEVGELTAVDINGASLISQLTNLTRLRLERSNGNSGAILFLQAVAALPSLRQLELINFDIKQHVFEEVITRCTNIKRLLIIPTYVSQSATTNRSVLEGVLRLKNTLTHLMWGITMELLRVTELFIDQCDRNQALAQGGNPPVLPVRPPKKPDRKPGTGDCIPILKPVPGLHNEDGRTNQIAGKPQVEILPLPTLQRLLEAELPDTRLKLLRIPYHHTWRQTFNEFD